MMYKRSRNDKLRKVALAILIGLIALGLLLPSFMSVLWGLGQ